MLPFPEPPWRLRGRAVAVPVLLDRERVTIPPPLGGAGAGAVLVGLLVVASYEAGSTLEYGEAAVLVLVRRGLRAGAYVHRIWVDDETSVAGGLAIWGLAKQRAAFAWDGTSRAPVAEIRGEAGILLRVSARAFGLPVPLPIATPLRVFVRRPDRFEEFTVRLRGSARLARARIATASDTLGLRRPLPAPAVVWTGVDATVLSPRRLCYGREAP